MLLLATLSFFALSANAQTMSPSEVMEIIQDNTWENYRNGVDNPNLIMPGQTLSYHFKDGYIYVFTVQPGESQYSIVRDRLPVLIAIHGEVVAPPQKDSVMEDTILPMDPVKKDWYEGDVPWWMWPIVVALIALAAFGGSRAGRNERKRYEDPVTAGPPQVSGGVGDRGARARVQQIAQDQFPSANIQVENVRRGRLSGPAMVHYAGVNPQQKVLDNIFAYAGEVTINGIRQTVYFLQGCGNDARRGNFMTGSELLFTPDAEITEDGTATPVPPAPAVDVKTKITGQTSEVHNLSITTSPTPSDCVMKGLEIIEKYVSSSEVKHEVTFNLTREGLQVTMKGQNNQTKTQA